MQIALKHSMCAFKTIKPTLKGKKASFCENIPSWRGNDFGIVEKTILFQISQSLYIYIYMPELFKTSTP